MEEDATATTLRELPRDEHLEPGYSPARHAVRTAVLATSIGALGLYLARTATAADWLFLPLFLCAANAIEWAFHKNPMHRPLKPRILYKNHSLLHHRAFHHDHMQIERWEELGLIMMPWYTMLLLFVLASPIAFVAAAIRGSGVAGIFFFTAAFYFVLYESLHAFYHLPAPVLRRMGLGGPVFQRLQAHHTHHHRLDRMSHVNFNVTFPLMDWLMGTKERGALPRRSVVQPEV